MSIPEWRLKGIMRHGQAFRPGMDPQAKASNSSLTSTGLSATKAVGRRLAESIEEVGIKASDLTVVCACSPVARDTASAITSQLKGARPAVPLEELDPAEWMPGSEESPEARWKKIDKAIGELGLATSAVVVVGHDPQTSWLLHRLIKEQGVQQRLAGPLPLARGELAAIVRRPGSPSQFVVWVLSPSDDKLIEELQAKIKSKMETAKLLGAFVTALLVFAARELSVAKHPPIWYPWVAGLGLVLLALSTAAYFVTMFRYDELLMPVRLWPSPWPSGRPLPRGFVLRPPSSASLVLYQNMMRVWSNAFTPATLLGGFGAIAVTIALARPQGIWWLVVGLSTIAVLCVIWFVWHQAKPTTGVSD